jgi:predicted CoA-binding protein
LLVQPINPSRPAITVSSTVYPTVPSPSALPFPTETSLSIITQPSVTLQILREAKRVGIPAVWLQPGSFDDEGWEYAKREFVAAIGGKGGKGESGWCVLMDGDNALAESQNAQQVKL